MKRMTLVLLMLLLTWSAAAYAQDDPCMFTVGGVLDTDTGQCSIKVSINLNVNYPPLQDQPAFVAQAIQDFVSSTTSDFLANFTSTPLPPTQSSPWELWLEYESFQYLEQLVSYKFTLYEFTGGAHGNTTFRTFTFDLSGAREITLSDLFDDKGLAAVAQMAQDQLKTTLDATLTDPQWLQQGTAPTPENYANFVLTPDSLIFYFPAYQVAAYVAGPQTIEIPLSALRGVSIAPFLNAK